MPTITISKRVMNIIVAVVAVFTLAGAIWGFDERYISAAELKQSNKQIHLRMDEAEYRGLTESYYRTKDLIRTNPNSSDLKEQLEQIRTERIKVKENIDKAIRSTNGD